MNSVESARYMFRRARLIYEEAQNLYTRGSWNLVVRRCQEAVELALKAALLWVGVQPPPVHDVGPALKAHRKKFPRHFAEAVPAMASISRALRAERETSFYGEPETGVPPEVLYEEADAEEALTKARFVLENCVQLMGEV